MLDFNTRIHSAGQSAQNFCMRQVPPHLHKELTAAMVCGASISNSAHREAFQVSGLLHLLVVSGAHLHFLLSLLRRLSLPSSVKLLCVTGYALISGWQAPCVRALIQLGLGKSPKTAPLRAWQMVWLSGILTVLFFPEFAFGFSLLMSWICALVMSLLTKDKWLTAVGLYTMLFPVLLNWSPAHPLTIVLNLAVAPVVGFVALPLCLLSLVFPSLAWVLDQMWNPFIQLLNLLAPILRTTDSARTDLLLIYFCLVVCHLIWEFLYVSKQRTLACCRQPLGA